MTSTERQHYRYLAYIVLRDALAFYLGIPKFLNEENIKLVYEKALSTKLSNVEKTKGRQLSSSEINKYTKSVARSFQKKIKELKNDYKHCEEVLFLDNLWLQSLDIDPEFLREYVNKLTDQAKNNLAVVPRWGVNDFALSRNYINDNFSYNTNKFV